MTISDDAVEIRSQGWRRLAALHDFIDSALEKKLQAHHGLSVVEYTVLDALGRQHDGWHMRMRQLARAAGLSSSASTRLVNRLEERELVRRVLCSDDRRGIYAELTAEGRRLLESSRATHDAELAERLQAAESVPELRGLAQLVSTSARDDVTAPNSGTS